MTIVALAVIKPLDPATGERITLRIASASHRAVNGLGGFEWEPAMLAAPTLSSVLFNGDFTAEAGAGSARMAINMNTVKKRWPLADRYFYAQAECEIYLGSPGDAWPWSPRFVGRLDREFTREGQTLTLTAKPDDEPFRGDLLINTYAGTGGMEGPSDLKGRPKPLVIGWAQNVEPLPINQIENVYQVSGYGPIEAVTTLYERGSAFPASVGDYANYAALVAATIPNGGWATCLAEGLIRLGAPPYGVITADVKGHRSGATTPRKTGAVISTLAAVAGVDTARIDAASMAAIDLAVPYPINLVVTEQVTLLDLAQQMALACNAQAIVSLAGMLALVRPDFGGAAAIDLHADGKRWPQVRKSVESGVSAPYWRVIMGANRCWRVHSTEEIAWDANLIDRGQYDNAATYREGNYVSRADGSQWLYINATPSAGNAPPTWPTTSNAYWANMKPPVQADYATQIINLPEAIDPVNILPGGRIDAEQVLYGPGGPAVIELQPAEAGANVTETRTAAAFVGQGAFATQNSVGYGSPLLTGFGSLAPRDTVLAGSHLRNSADTVYLGDGDIVTTQGTAAGIFGQAWAATNGVQSAVDNSYVSGFANQAIDSEFTLGTTCWGESYVSGGAWAYSFFTALTSKRFIERFNASALAGQQVNLGQTTSCGIPVVEGDKVECSAILSWSNMSTVTLYIGWFDTSGTYAGATSVGAGSFDTRIGGFAIVPAGMGIATAKVLAVFNVAANGASAARMAQPLIRRCPVNQVILSPYNPGPLHERGANVTETRVAAAVNNQGAGATANSLADLDATAAAQLTTALNGGLVVAGWGESLKRRIADGASINLSAQVSVAAGGSTSGTIKARIEVSPLGANSWSTVDTGDGASVTPSEPGIDTVSGTYTNGTGAEQLFEFRVTIVRTPGTAGGSVIAAQSYVEG